jgi:hypothetical protein
MRLVNELGTEYAQKRAALNAKIPGSSINYKGKFIFARNFAKQS